MTMEFIDSEDDFPFLRDDFDMEREFYGPIRELQAEGYVDVPRWMPVGLPGYFWACVATRHVMMRPGPKWYHWLRYRVFR